MVGVCFKYDSGYKSLLRDQAFELMRAFPNVVIYERSTASDEPADYNGQAYTQVTNADDLPAEPTLVVVSAQDADHVQGTVSLDDYVHPTSAIYFFGCDHASLTQADIGTTTTYDKVYIPISENVWSTQAMGMVLLDRQQKNG